MKRNFFKLVFVALIFGAYSALAQSPAVIYTNHKLIGKPYVVGENLVYEGKYKKFGLAFSIADMGFTVSRTPDGANFHINSLATSRGTLTKLFNFEFLQRIESIVDPEKLQALKTEKRDEQGKRIRESVADFNYQDMTVRYIESDPVDPSRPPRRVASTISLNTQDVVTAVYMLRRMPLSVGAKILLKVSDSGLVYDVPVNVTAREQKKSILGNLWCWRVEPEIFGDKKFIEQEGSLTIWITDDARRIPVRAELETKLGDVDIKLKELNLPKNPPATTDNSTKK